MDPGDLLLERFELEQPVGGGMGVVFRARDRASGEVVAVKVITERWARQAERFRREIEVLAELSHPGIVRYIAHGETPEGAPFLVMEWLDGEDLRSRLARAPLSAGETVQLATRVADALAAVHARGIVHRDLKPSNLFLPGGQIDQVKLLDFGIARRAGRTQLTQTGVLLGSAGYMAPEQARAAGAVDARADVFALGSVMYLCLTGAPAFAGDSVASTLGKILFGEAPRVSALWPEVPEDLDALVGRMLSRDPALRPSDGAQLGAALATLAPMAPGTGPRPAARAAPISTTGSGERRFVAVVLLGSPGDASDEIDAETAAAAAATLERASRPYGGRLEKLADGSTLVVLDVERLLATDLAAQAARCALALRAHAGGLPMAVAMGRAETVSELPRGAAIDRAWQLLARSSAAAGASSIAVDEVTAGLLDARFDVAEAAAGPVLRGMRPVLQGTRTLLGRPTPCVGRDWELGLLEGLLEECVAERQARAVVVTGGAGLGKSRLAAELVSRLGARGDEVSIWVGRGDSLRAGSTLDLIAQALRGALGIPEGAPPAERWARLSARVAEHVPAAGRRRVAEFLGELTGAPCPDEPAPSAQLAAARQDALLMSEQVSQAWLDFLGAEAAARPVLLILEDLHWSDFGTIRFIDLALRDRADRPYLVLALARPEVHETFPRMWAERQNVQEIRLKELGRKAGERLVRQVLADDVGPETVERLLKLANGNAFYLEELIRAVAEHRDAGGAVALPETVLAMVETRLGRLSLEARRVLRAASVFGEVCPEGGVIALLEGALSAAAVGEEIGRLVEQELVAVRPQGRFPGSRDLAFRHALLREGAYATATAEDRAVSHRLAGEWLARHGEGDPMVLAGHFERGGDGAQAALHYLRGAEQAFHVLDLDATMARVDLGLRCGPPPELRLALLGMRCEAAGNGLQLVPSAMPAAEELLRAAPRGSVRWAQGMNLYLQGTMIMGRIGELMAALGQIRDLEPAPDALGKLAITFLAGINISDVLGKVADGTALEQQFTAILRAPGAGAPLPRFWWNLAFALRASYAHDDPWDALQHAEAMDEIHHAVGGQTIYLGMQMLRGFNRWLLGAHAAAQRLLESIPAADAALGMGSSLRRFGLAWLHADRGAHAVARDIAAGLAEDGRAHHNPLDEGRGRWALAEALRRAGDLDGADRELAAALALAMPLERPGVLGSLAALRLAQGRAAEAIAAAEEGLGMAAAIGGCGMFRGAFLRLAHAEALHAAGAAAAARPAIADARAYVLAAAAKITDPAARASFLGGVPENARILELASAWLGEPAPAPA